MLGRDAAPSTAGGLKEPRALAEDCRAVRERLESIARALGALREEIDRALRDERPAEDGGTLGGPPEHDERSAAG